MARILLGVAGAWSCETVLRVHLYKREPWVSPFVQMCVQRIWLGVCFCKWGNSGFPCLQRYTPNWGATACYIPGESQGICLQAGDPRFPSLHRGTPNLDAAAQYVLRLPCQVVPKLCFCQQEPGQAPWGFRAWTYTPLKFPFHVCKWYSHSQGMQDRACAQGSWRVWAVLGCLHSGVKQRSTAK